LPQRQQMPFNWFIPPGQAGSYNHPQFNQMMNRPMGQMGPMNQMRGRGLMGQMSGRGSMGQMGPLGVNRGRQGGGLLAKILGKKSPPMGGFPGFYPTAQGAVRGGSFLQNLTNPTAISGFLNNTQNVLKAAQQISPMVQQYGPLLRNLPAMWRLYRGLKSGTDDNDTDQNESSDVENTEDESSESSQPEIPSEKDSSKKVHTAEKGSGKKVHTSESGSGKKAHTSEKDSGKNVHTSEKSSGKTAHSKKKSSAKKKNEAPNSLKKSGASIPKLFI
jgi:hypothetical protein